MTAINCMFAQTIFTCPAKKYEGDLFHIITSLNPKEDILEGKSYYLGEAKAILSILQEQEKGLIFDYHIKEGIGTKSNAIKLLEYIGYPEEVTKEANETLEELRKII